MTLLWFVLAGFLLGGAISVHRQGRPKASLALAAASAGSLAAWLVGTGAVLE